MVTDIAQAQEWLGGVGRLSRIDVRAPAAAPSRLYLLPSDGRRHFEAPPGLFAGRRRGLVLGLGGLILLGVGAFLLGPMLLRTGPRLEQLADDRIDLS